jgi:hypothetical protein
MMDILEKLLKFFMCCAPDWSNTIFIKGCSWRDLRTYVHIWGVLKVGCAQWSLSCTDSRGAFQFHKLALATESLRYKISFGTQEMPLPNKENLSYGGIQTNRYIWYGWNVRTIFEKLIFL